MLFREGEADKGNAGAAGAGAAGAGAKGAGAGSATEPGAGGEGDKGEGSRSAAWKAAEQYKAENVDLKRWKSEREAADVKAEEARAKKNGEYEQIAEKAKAEAATAREQGNKAVMRAALIEGAVANGLPVGRLALVDTSKVTIAADGTVAGIKEAFDALKAADPGAFGTADVKIKDSTTSRGTAGGADFSEAEIKRVASLGQREMRAWLDNATPAQKAQVRAAAGLGALNGRVDPLTGRRIG